MKDIKKGLCIVLVACMLITLLVSVTGCGSVNGAEAAKGDSKSSVTLTDMVGREVTIEGDVERVVIIEWEAMAAKALKKMGLADKIVGIDDYATKNTFRNYIIPEFANAKDIGSA